MSPAAISTIARNKIADSPGCQKSDLQLNTCITPNQFAPILTDAEIFHKQLSLFSRAFGIIASLRNELSFSMAFACLYSTVSSLACYIMSKSPTLRLSRRNVTPQLDTKIITKLCVGLFGLEARIIPLKLYFPLSSEEKDC